MCGQISFAADDSSSKANDTGRETVPVDTLDHLVENKPVTYIKMDVEGMECAVLRGAKGVIHAYRPKLAICTDHSNADMIQVPLQILHLNLDYQLYFKHYTNALVEIVCYAI